MIEDPQVSLIGSDIDIFLFSFPFRMQGGYERSGSYRDGYDGYGKHD